MMGPFHGTGSRSGYSGGRCSAHPARYGGPMGAADRPVGSSRWGGAPVGPSFRLLGTNGARLRRGRGHAMALAGASACELLSVVMHRRFSAD